ncbi:hypothetical protein C8R46DRAFT_1030596 [Mycena filopes]|nr:hypothetical protein C8R46DRAFT_1030596 [Mycena filopes]
MDINGPYSASVCVDYMMDRQNVRTSNLNRCISAVVHGVRSSTRDLLAELTIEQQSLEMLERQCYGMLARVYQQPSPSQIAKIYEVPTTLDPRTTMLRAPVSSPPPGPPPPPPPPPGPSPQPMITQATVNQEVLKTVRVLMLQLLKIRIDKDIFSTHTARQYTTVAESAAYFRGESSARRPGLDPLRPCWDDLDGQWNMALETLFVERFDVEYPHLQGHAQFIRLRFRLRLARLGHTIRKRLNDIKFGFLQEDLRLEKDAQDLQSLDEVDLKMSFETHNNMERIECIVNNRRQPETPTPSSQFSARTVRATRAVERPETNGLLLVVDSTEKRHPHGFMSMNQLRQNRKTRRNGTCGADFAVKRRLIAGLRCRMGLGIEGRGKGKGRIGVEEAGVLAVAALSV